MKVTFTGSGVGQRRCWESESMGSGCMEITALTAPTYAKYVLEIKGWDTPSDAEMLLSPTQNGNTLVTWKMSGKLNYPIGRLFGLMLDSKLGKDFDKGLAQLKQHTEKKK